MNQKLHFTKMTGAGNDFVVIDAVTKSPPLAPAMVKKLADRRFGVGADQVLVVRLANRVDCDFYYQVFNADGKLAEHCGNGARCLWQFLHDSGLTSLQRLHIETINGSFDVECDESGSVRVNMGSPNLALAAVGFDAQGLSSRRLGELTLWSLPAPEYSTTVEVALVSMGNPHAVICVDDVDNFAVDALGAYFESHPRFANKANIGFMQVQSPERIKLRVFERGVGETLACGTGACAAVAAGRLAGMLAPRVDVAVLGGMLSIEWPGSGQDLWLGGPAVSVFNGEINWPPADHSQESPDNVL